MAAGRLMTATSVALADALAHAPVLVQLLEEEPDFGIGVDEVSLAEARRRTLVPAVTVAPGPQPWVLPAPRAPIGPFAALVLGGLIVRECVLAGRATAQLLGAGDVIGLSQPEETIPGVRYAVRAATETRIAVLDERFLAAAQRWPWLTARLAERTARWADRALMLQAISQLGRVDARIVALFWHLADRWGRVSPDGLIVPLKLTHAALGTLVGAARPTVTLALKDLAERGTLHRRGDEWVLGLDSRELVLAEERQVAKVTTLSVPSPLRDGRGS